MNTAELYLPSSGDSCTVPHLPDERAWHTLERSGLICGGVFYWSTCLEWSPSDGTWRKALPLKIGRYYHFSWSPARPGMNDGTYLMGGGGEDDGGTSSKRTTTLIKSDWNKEPGFILKYDTK